MLKLGITPRFHVCFETPLVYKQRIKLYMGIEERNPNQIKEREYERPNQISGISLFYIIVMAVIRVNICYNKA